ncbi:TPR repeat-containing protein [Microseira wollei NIES-4236]|uniref:TPR repeat-containing protein n=1 Tax=Microseira wollei NIES-4236 TaxID=2530354 RepID=A0AAV3XIY4_9CYAN|nr:TPR repeat-containing protein [Microseira wollei NIES-4236]
MRKLKRFEEAVASHDQELKTNPNLLQSLNVRETMLRQLLRYEEAMSSYEKAIKINSNYYTAC